MIPTDDLPEATRIEIGRLRSTLLEFRVIYATAGLISAADREEYLSLLDKIADRILSERPGVVDHQYIKQLQREFLGDSET